MGKPSSTSSLKSNKSANSSRSNSSERKMNAAMSSTKVQIRSKKKKYRLNRKIKHLFTKLRNETVSQSSENNTVINLDDTVTPRKRKLSPIKSGEKLKMRKGNRNSTVIIINDDNVSQTCTPRKESNPIHCSTPLATTSSNALNDLNVSNISKVKNNNSIAENFNNDVNNLTREINIDSYLTIDLTAETNNTGNTEPQTVIDLNNLTESQDCLIVASNTSMSGDSDVTVLKYNRHKSATDRKIQQFANGIASLDPTSKGKLLEMITAKIFSGCNIPTSLKDNLNQAKESRATETAEDTYIKEVIVGKCPSRNSIGSNIYNPERDAKKTGLRMIVIDGSNVAMEHGRGRVFSVKGLKICIDYFLKRGHAVKAFVPRFRCKFGKSTEPRLLDELERRGLVVYTPSREVQGKLITSYDDRYIVQCAAEFDGVIVSGDNYRDLMLENARWRRVIERRLLPFTWVQDMIMFPRDPLGRNGPTLEQFLRHGPESQ